MINEPELPNILYLADTAELNLPTFVNKYDERAHAYLQERGDTDWLNTHPTISNNITERHQLINKAINNGFFPVEIGKN